MKRKVLALSIAAMIGGVAQAQVATVGQGQSAAIQQPAGVFIGAEAPGYKTDANGVVTQASIGQTTANSLVPAGALGALNNGQGHINIVPYYTAQNGNSTLLSITNNDMTNGKAVKVRFRGARNSDDVLDFTLLLSPMDVWTGVVTKDANGLAQLSTADTSCTIPASVRGPGYGKGVSTTSFVTSRVLGGNAAETLEGYVEILTMADIVPGSALFTAVKHVDGVAPCTNATLTASLGSYPQSILEAAKRGLAGPTGTLTGSWTVVDTASSAVAWSGENTSLVAVVDTAGVITGPGRARVVVSPQLSSELRTSAIAASAADMSADPLFFFGTDAQVPVGMVRPVMYDLPDLSTPYVAGANNAAVQADELSRALAVQRVTNDYLTDGNIGAATDWVFSMPTRRYAVAVAYDAPVASRLKFRGGVGNAFFNSTNTRLEGNSACVVAPAYAGIQSTDREERVLTGNFVVSPGTTPELKLCGEVNVLAFNETLEAGDATPTISGRIAVQGVDVTYTDGFATINTANAGAGLPVVGSAFQRASDGKANYSITLPHRR